MVLFDNQIKTNLSQPQALAWDKWLHLNLPTRKQERWKYTSLKHVEQIMLHVPVEAQNTPLFKDQLIEHDYHQIVFENGFYREALSTLPKGVQLQVSEQYDNSDNEEALVYLNQALARQNWQLTVDANTVLDKPIVIVDAIDTAHTTNHILLDISIEKSAQCKIIHYPLHVGDKKTLATESTKINLSENAKLDYLFYSPTHQSLSKVTMFSVRQARDSVFKHDLVDFGSQLSRIELDVYLNGEAAKTELNGIYYGYQNLQIDNYLRVHHNASYTKSQQNYKGLADDSSTTVFSGSVYVAEGLQGIEAHQSNPNLLLSDKASMNTKPELMIYSDDVKCAHGATIGELDEVALFYLRSRGIPKKQARNMLIHAFLQEIIKDFPEDNFTKAMHSGLDALSTHDD